MQQERNTVRPPCTQVRKEMPDGLHAEVYRRNVYMSREDNVYVPVFTNPYYKYDSRSDSHLALVGDLQDISTKKDRPESGKRKKKSKKDSRGKSSKTRSSSSKSKTSSKK